MFRVLECVTVVAGLVRLQLFKEPDVTPADDVTIAFTDPDVEGIVQFLCGEKGTLCFPNVYPFAVWLRFCLCVCW